MLSDSMDYETGHTEVIYHNTEEGPSRLRKLHKQETYIYILSAFWLLLRHTSMASFSSGRRKKVRLDFQTGGYCEPVPIRNKQPLCYHPIQRCPDIVC